MLLLQKVTLIVAFSLMTACSGTQKLDCRPLKKALSHLPSTPEKIHGQQIGVTKKQYFFDLYGRLVKTCNSCEEVRDSMMQQMLRVDPHELKARTPGPRYSDYLKQFKND
jgi:hypothetical protein